MEFLKNPLGQELKSDCTKVQWGDDTMKKIPLVTGVCNKRDLVMDENNLCDWFESRRTTKYRVCCRNCKFFKPDPPKKSKEM